MTTADFGGKFGISFPRSKSMNFSEFIATGYISRAPLTNPSTDLALV